MDRKYWMKPVIPIRICIFILGCILVLLWLFLNDGLKRHIPSFTIPEEEWTKLDRSYEVEGEYFYNAGEWHYATEYEQLAAWAVRDYAEKNGLEQKKWFLRHMYREDGSVNAFVCSGTGRELYLLLDEENEKYLVTVDWKVDDLSDYQYSEYSRLVWYDYWEWYNLEQSGQKPEYDFVVAWREDYYENNFWQWSAHALRAYLYSVAPNNRDTWVCMQKSFYMGKNGCIGDVWYDSGKEKIHMLVNMNNKEYTILEVL